MAQFHAPLAVQNLEVVYRGFDAQTRQTLYQLQQIKERKLEFDSSLDVVLFINRVAAIFGRPPVKKLQKTNMRREVLVFVNYSKQEWVDEGEWLADLALATVIEKQLLEAFLNLQKENDTIKLTLKASDDVRGAARIYDSYGFAFLIPQPDRNRLYEVCDKKEIPEGFTVAVEYRELITTGATALARSLAPYVTHVEMVLQ